MEDRYPECVLKTYPQFIDKFARIDDVQDTVHNILIAIENLAENARTVPEIVSLSKAGRNYLGLLDDVMNNIQDFCRAADVYFKGREDPTHSEAFSPERLTGFSALPVEFWEELADKVREKAVAANDCALRAAALNEHRP